MTMPDTEDYIVFDRTGTPHVVVAVKTEIGGNCPQSGNREVEGGQFASCHTQSITHWMPLPKLPEVER